MIRVRGHSRKAKRKVNPQNVKLFTKSRESIDLALPAPFAGLAVYLLFARIYVDNDPWNDYFLE
jgi:hypothetical protein